MQFPEAVRILILAAERDLIGQGCGIRTLPEGKERKKLIDAIEICHNKVYQFPYERKNY